MEVLSAVLRSFSSLTDGCVTVVCWFLRINEHLGSVILGACLYAVSVAQLFLDGFNIAYTELILFMKDIVCLVYAAANVVDMLVRGSADCVVGAFSGLLFVATFLKTSVVNGCSSVFLAVTQAVQSCGSFLVLVTKSALFLVKLLPCMVRQLANYLYLGVCGVAACIAAVCDFVESAVITVACALWDFLFGQPEDVYAGLLILFLSALIALVLVRARAHRTLWQGVRRVVDTVCARRRRGQRRRSGSSETSSHPPFTMTLRRNGNMRRDRMRRIQEELEEERKKQICVVCMIRQRSVMFLPCRHYALCEECIGVLIEQQQETCPMCRQLIYEVVPVYT